MRLKRQQDVIDENEGSTVMDPKMSLQYEKLLDSGDVMCCPRVSNEWELSTRHVTKRSRIRFARWGFASVLASLIKFYPFHIQNVKDEDDGEKKIRRPFRTLFDKGAFLTECRHSEKERAILDRIVEVNFRDETILRAFWGSPGNIIDRFGGSV